jgi:hypothetical protein
MYQPGQCSNTGRSQNPGQFFHRENGLHANQSRIQDDFYTGVALPHTIQNHRLFSSANFFRTTFNQHFKKSLEMACTNEFVFLFWMFRKIEIDSALL